MNKTRNSEKYKKKLETELKIIVDILVSEYKPEKIIVFGSFVKGRVHEWSDLDIIVIKDTKKRFFDRIGEVSSLIPHNVPIDMVVYTPDEFKKMSELNYFIRSEVIDKGKVLYE